MLKFSGSSCLISGPICKIHWIQDSFQDHHTNMLSHIAITIKHPTQHSLHKHISTDIVSPKQSPSSRLQQQNVTTLHSHTQYTYSSCHYFIYMHVHTLKHSVRTQTSESAKKWFTTTLASCVNRHWNRHASRSTRKRNLRSKIWWFTVFCNSHYVSHFAAFFIVARA